MTNISIADTALMFGDCPAIERALTVAGFRHASPAGLLVNAEAHPDLDAVVARCLAFAEALPDGEEGLVVTIIGQHAAGLEAWRAHATAAGLTSFTRDAALAWGPRRIRVNMIEVLRDVPEDDVAACLMVMLRLPSMTGQTISLGTR